MKILVISILALFLIEPLYAGDASSTGMAFLKVGGDAASTAMGGAAVSNSSGTSAIYWNPAGLANNESSEAIFSHQEWLAGSINQQLGITFPGNKISFGLGAAFSGVGDIERRDERPTVEPLGYFSANSVALSLSAAKSQGNDIQIGVTFKFLYEKIFTYSANGFAVDFGIKKQLSFHDLSAAVVVKDLGGMSSLNVESTQLPARITGGISGDFLPYSSSTFKWSFDAGKYFDSSAFIRFGGDLALNETLNLRAGYRKNSKNSSGYSAGFGIHRKGYRFDYAYLPFDFNFRDTHQITFRIGF